MQKMGSLLKHTLLISLVSRGYSFLPPNLLPERKTLLQAAKADIVPDLLFQSGDVPLEPQNLPPFLHPYHTKNLELTEDVFQDVALTCNRGKSYGKESHQLLDIWTKSKSRTTSSEIKKPIVIFLHGGGWDYGYREWVGFCARNICRQGTIMIAPSYKIGKGSGEKLWPQSRNDIITALKWISQNADKYGGDPSKIILAGHSAGGHLAASVCLNQQFLESSGFDSQSIKALFLISSPLGVRPDDIFMMFHKRLWWKMFRRPINFLFHRWKPSFLQPFTGEGGKANEFRTTLQDASPLYAASTNIENTCFPQYIHVTYASKKDFPFCAMHAKELERQLNQKTIEILELPVEGHFETHFSLDDASSDWYTSFRKIISKINADSS